MGSMANDGLAAWVGKAGKKFRLPLAHQPFMENPGGFSCSRCRFLRSREDRTCGSPDFQRYFGTDKIPGDGPLEEACSDWFEPSG